MSELGLPIALIGCLLLVNGFFVAAEFALAAAPEMRIARHAESGSAAAQRLLAILRNARAMNNYISAAQVGITIASLGLGMYGEHAIADWILAPLQAWGVLGVAAAHTAASVLAVTILTYLHVVIGEMVPKSLALAAPDVTALRVGPWMHIAQIIFRPLTWLLNLVGESLLFLAGIPPADAKARLVSSAELEYIVEESAVGGMLEPKEQLYLENVLDFGERTVGQVMTPRTRMQALPITAGIDDVLQTVCEHGYSRYPVYEDDRDQIVGILYVKDLARELSHGIHELDLGAVMRPAVFTPETVALELMLQRFRAEHTQIAIVVDEFGGTAGLVTLEDLVEELIGEIQDEFDEEIPPLEEITANVLRARGDLLLDELSQHYDVDFDDEDADTVGGLVMAHLTRIPEPGESVIVAGVKFEVESVEGLAVNTVIIRLPTPPIHEDEAAAERTESVVQQDNVLSASG